MPENYKIHVYTVAYNAEKTLRRAIESVLSQTHNDIIYVIHDNGSTDGTYTLCKEYALKDSRVVFLHNTRNNVLEMEERTRIEAANKRNGVYLGDNDFWCLLDADDEYVLDFFERGVRFAEEQNLDIVIGGTEMIDEQTKKIAGHRIHNKAWVINGQIFSSMLPQYHWHMRQVWGKLYRRKVLLGKQEYIKSLLERELKEKASLGMSYGTDTIDTMYSFSKANKIGILDGCQHKYYMQNKSVSHVFGVNRIASDRILDEATRSFLIEKVGAVSPQNLQFLHLVYFNAIKDTLDVVLNAKLAATEKFQHINDIFTYETTKELFKHSYATDYESNRELRSPVLKWLLAQKECRKPEGAKATAEIIAAMYSDLSQAFNQESLSFVISKMPEMVAYLLKKDYAWVLERLSKWNKNHDADEPALTELEISIYRALNKPDDEMFTFLADIRKKRPISSKRLDIESQIYELTAKYPLLKNVSAKLASVFPRAVCLIVKENFPQALELFFSATQGIEIADDDIEAYLMLAQNLSAVAGHTDAYVHFKKIWISYLLDNSRNEEAHMELGEMEQLLPGDEDLGALRKKLLS